MSTASPHVVPSRFATWWTILRICIEERLVYRGDFMLGTLMRFLPLVTQVFLWIAVFAGSGKATMLGYTKNEMIAYYLLTNVGRAFSSMPGLASSISRQIRSGEIKKYLVQPVDMIGFLLLSRIAHKLVYYLVAILPYAFVFYLCRGYFSGWPDATTLLAFAASLVMGFMIGYLLEALCGMIGFWLLEVHSLLFVVTLLMFFFSGQMYPLEMLPGTFGMVIRNSPLAYLAYFPAVVFLGKVQGASLAWSLAAEFAWIIGLTVVLRIAFRRGVRRYAGYGG